MGSAASVYDTDSLETIDCDDLSYDEVTKRLMNGSICAIDVRERDEVQSTGIVSGAQNVPLGELESAFRLGSGEFYRRYGFPKPLKDNCQICVYCYSGVRAVQAVVALHQLGYTNVMRYPGGWQDWSMRHHRPLTKRTSHGPKNHTGGYPQATHDYYIPSRTHEAHCQAQGPGQDYLRQPRKPTTKGYGCPRQQQHDQQEYYRKLQERYNHNSAAPAHGSSHSNQMQVRAYKCRPRGRRQSFPQEKSGLQLPFQRQQQAHQSQRHGCDISSQDCAQVHPKGECPAKQANRMRTYDTYYYY